LAPEVRTISNDDSNDETVNTKHTRHHNRDDVLHDNLHGAKT